jgi:hypothetical protein
MAASINGIVGFKSISKDSNEKWMKREVYVCKSCLSTEEYAINELGNPTTHFTGYCRHCNHKLTYKYTKQAK